MNRLLAIFVILLALVSTAAVFMTGSFRAQRDEVVNAKANSVDCVQFIDDVTLPDWIQLTPGQQVTKTWSVQNCGTDIWNDRALAVRYGESPQPTKAGSAIKLIQPVPQLGPGETGNVSVELTVPETKGEWKLWFDIVKPNEKRGILWVFFKN